RRRSSVPPDLRASRAHDAFSDKPADSAPESFLCRRGTGLEWLSAARPRGRKRRRRTYRQSVRDRETCRHCNRHLDSGVWLPAQSRANGRTTSRDSIDRGTPAPRQGRHSFFRSPLPGRYLESAERLLPAARKCLPSHAPFQGSRRPESGSLGGVVSGVGRKTGSQGGLREKLVSSDKSCLAGTSSDGIASG